MTYLVVGAGFTGATVAEHIARELGESVVVVERRHRVGGSAEDYRQDGVLIQKYGPHVFHTNSSRVWDYVQRFGRWQAIDYRVAAAVDDALVPLPLDFRAVMECLEMFGDDCCDRMLARYGMGARVPILRLREEFPTFADWAIRKVFRGYNEKHWGMPFEEVPESVLGRLPFVVGEQQTYFTDKHQAVPVEGYTALIERMLDHPKIELRLARLTLLVPAREWKGVVWTGSPDDFFGEQGALPYRSVRFECRPRGLRAPSAPYITLTNPQHDGPTRMTDMGLMAGLELGEASPCVEDRPCTYVPGKNAPFYPIPLEKNIRLAQEYEKRLPKNVWFAGRLGTYTYLNMDQAIAQAMAVFQKIKAAA